MAEVGVAFVSIVPSAKGFGSALNSQVGSASTVAGSTGGKKAGTSFVGGFKGAVGPALAVVATAGIIKGLKGAIAEAREAQKVGALTAQVIKSTGGAANVTAKQVEQLSTAISNNVGVDDELIQKGANLLLTFKNVRNEVGAGNAIFNRATQAAVNLSAAGFGSIESASKMLGKALNDPVKGMTALGRAGVTFSASQQKAIKAMVKSGDLLGAQKIILGEVQTQVGGAARASVTAGEKMKVAWANAKESLGTALLPAIDQLQNAITTKIIPAFVSFIGFLQANPAIIKAFAIGIAAIAATFVIAFVAANAIVVGIGLLVAALVYAYTKSETFRGIVQGVFKFLSGYVKVHMAIISAVVKAGIVIALAAWKRIQEIVAFVRGAFNLARSIVKTVISNMTGSIRAGIGNIIKLWKKLPADIKSALGNLGKLLVNAGKSIVQGLIDGIKSKFGSLKSTLSSITALIPKSKGPPPKDRILLTPAGQMIIDSLIRGMQSRESTIKATLGTLTSGIGSAGLGIGSRFSSANLATTGGAASDRPIMTDDGKLLGWIKTVANGQARLVWNQQDQQGAMQARYATP